MNPPKTPRRPISFIAAMTLAVMSNMAHALTPEAAKAIAAGDNDDRITALSAAVAAPDEALSKLIDALLDDSAKIAGDKVLIVADGKATDAATGAETALPEGVEDVVNNNRMRRELEAAKAALGLFSDSVRVRNNAIAELKDSADESKLPLVDRALAKETEPSLKAKLEQLRAAMLIASGDKQKRIDAVNALASSSQPSVRSLLQERLNAGGEADPEVRAALTTAIKNVESRLAWGERLGVVFTGLSLGSILFLVALGLAITYGLMGVINMAHGELLMIGAYATYLTQNLFRQHLPGAFDYYIIAAIPVSFMAAALVGAVLERTVIRWLYGRPLETLLATWGISLVLIQLVRTIFGAQNVPVENPSWLSGGIEVMSNLTLPYNRIAIIAFAAMITIAPKLIRSSGSVVSRRSSDIMTIDVVRLSRTAERKNVRTVTVTRRRRRLVVRTSDVTRSKPSWASINSTIVIAPRRKKRICAHIGQPASRRKRSPSWRASRRTSVVARFASASAGSTPPDTTGCRARRTTRTPPRRRRPSSTR